MKLGSRLGVIVCTALVAVAFSSGCKKKDPDQLDETKQLENTSVNKEISNLRAQAAVAKDDFQRSEIYGRIGELESEKGDIGSSIKSANDSVKYYPASAKAHYLLGKSYIVSGRYAEAETELTTAVDIDQKYAPAYFELGNLYYKLRKFPDSIGKYNLAVKYDPQNYQAYNNLGAVYQMTNKFKEAEAAFFKVKELNPKFAGACKNLGILYETKMQRKKDALAMYQEYLRIKPNAPDRAAVKIWIANLEK
jgi:tetratricopeptide (TPR) repeat protein